MNWARTVPLGVAGSIVGWQTAKAILMPLVIWSSTAAGAALYVNWVIDSNRANVRMLMTPSRDQADAEDKPAQQVSAARKEPTHRIADKLAMMVATRIAFLDAGRDTAAHGSDAGPDGAGVRLLQRDEMVREDVLMFDQVDMLRRLPREAVGPDVLQKIAMLKQLDDRLRAIGSADL